VKWLFLSVLFLRQNIFIYEFINIEIFRYFFKYLLLLIFFIILFIRLTEINNSGRLHVFICLIHINCYLRDCPLSIINGGFLFIIIPLASYICTHTVIDASNASTIARRILGDYAVWILVFNAGKNYFGVSNSNRCWAKRTGFSLEWMLHDLEACTHELRAILHMNIVLNMEWGIRDHASSRINVLLRWKLIIFRRTTAPILFFPCVLRHLQLIPRVFSLL
jgi:hypothetical protein